MKYPITAFKIKYNSFVSLEEHQKLRKNRKITTERLVIMNNRDLFEINGLKKLNFINQRPQIKLNRSNKCTNMQKS